MKSEIITMSGFFPLTTRTLLIGVLCVSGHVWAQAGEVPTMELRAAEEASMPDVASADAQHAFRQAHQWALRVEDQTARDRVLDRIASSAAMADTALALECVDGIVDEGTKERVLQVVYKRWAERDAAAAVEHAMGLQDSRRSSCAIAGLVNGVKDKVLARILADAIEDTKLQAGALVLLAVQTAETNPHEAVQLLGVIRMPEWEGAAALIMADLAEADLESADQIYDQLESDWALAVAARAIAKAHLDKGNVQKALAAVSRAPQPSRDRLLVDLLPSVYPLDKQIAQNIPATVEHVKLRNAAYFQLGMSLYGGTPSIPNALAGYPKESASWVEAGLLAGAAKSGAIPLPLKSSLADTTVGDALLTAIAAICQEKGLIGSAVDAAQGITDNVLREQCLTAIAAGAVEQSPLLAIDICRNKVTESWKKAPVIARAAAYLVRTQPSAREWLNAELKSMADAALSSAHPTRSDLFRFNDVVAAWAEFDPAVAAEYSLTRDAGEYEPMLFGNIAEQWGRRDFASAMKWGNELSKTALVKAYVFSGLGKARQKREITAVDCLENRVSWDFFLE